VSAPPPFVIFAETELLPAIIGQDKEIVANFLAKKYFSREIIFGKFKKDRKRKSEIQDFLKEEE